MPANDWNPQLYAQHHGFVWQHGQGVVELLAPQPGERILDVGCGTGELTSAIAASGASIVGMDASPRMVEAARRAFPDIEFITADARDFAFPRPFEAVFSNAALHWIPEAEAARAARCMANALRPGGRLVIEMGGRGNVAAIQNAFRVALREVAGRTESFERFYPTVGQYANLLEETGLEVSGAWHFDRPTQLDDGPDGLRLWLQMFNGEPLQDLAPKLLASIFERVESALRPALWRDGSWFADYRRLRMTAMKR